MNKKYDTKKLADLLFPIKAEEKGFEATDVPPEQRRLSTETYDFSIATIKDFIDKGIIFRPEFQRKYVWNRSQASRLIESLVIQCPIPVIYLNQEPDEHLSVIDGNQRLSAIELFLNNDFPLYGLSTYPELNGSSFNDLDPRIQRHIQNRTLRCITIMKETHPQIKFDVFERINTGAVQLNPQEIRNGIYFGDAISLIDELSKENVWKEITGFKKDSRMKGNELILRYFSFLENFSQYKKPLKNFLNNFAKRNRTLSDSQKLQWKNNFLTAIETAQILFGKKAFKILNLNGEFTKSINAALCDVTLVGITKQQISPDRAKHINLNQFMKNYKQLLSDESFTKFIKAGTSDKKAVIGRFEKFNNFLDINL